MPAETTWKAKARRHDRRFLTTPPFSINFRCGTHVDVYGFWVKKIVNATKVREKPFNTITPDKFRAPMA